MKIEKREITVKRGRPAKQKIETRYQPAAIEAKRKVRIIHQLSQAADHPINIFHPEGEYLKGLVLQVD